MAAADLVVGASGSSTWEMLCLGVPAALAWVAGNQERGHAIVAGRGLAAGLGRLAGLKEGGLVVKEAIETLRTLLAEPAARQALARRAHAAIDGRGRERVADALLARAA
jgi:spore coat polysaccharide biosynthesis predicted glycosyltransferase SpsG